MEIRKCADHDIARLGKFYDDEVGWMDAHGMNYPLWTYRGYPTESTVCWTVGEGTQFVCTEKETVLGAFMLNTDPLGDYDSVPWGQALHAGEYMIIHMLCVAHEHYGKGIAKAMTQYCIRHAKEHGFRGIRLDVVPTNLPAKRLYESLGFRAVGDFDLGKGVAKIPLFSMYELYF